MSILIIPVPGNTYNLSLALRQDVLRTPLGLDIKDEDLSHEHEHIHFGAFEEDTLVGIVVLIPEYKPQTGKLRQMATHPKVRGQGYGKQLVYDLEDYARIHNMHTIELNARHYAVDFYKMLGYEISGEPFTEVGIKHFKMIKKLTE